MIEVNALSHRYEGVRALDAVTLAAAAGEVVGVVGPNGSGKSTLLSAIAGEVRPGSGSISFQGARIDGKAAYAIARRGVRRTFQSPRLIDDLTALENATIGCGDRRAFARETLIQLGFRSRVEARASSLRHSDRRRAELVRALCAQPALLLLDEILAGLTFAHAEQFRTVIAEYARGRGAVVLLADRDLSSVSRICDRAIVLHAGRKIAEGKPDEVHRNPEVHDAYLGVEWRQ